MIAFIISIDPTDYHFIYKLKNKINIIKEIADIFLVFSNQNEYECFKYKDDFKNIIISSCTTDNIVTYKKFYAFNPSFSFKL